MHKRKKKTRIIALLLAIAGGLVSPPAAMAQSDGGGLFGRGGTRDNSEVSSGVINQGFGNTGGSFISHQGFGGTGAGVGNQGFGGTNGGITNQGFVVPVGSGLLVLVAACAGYATLKKRNKKTKQQKHNTK